MSDDLLRRVEAGELGDPLPVLAYVAGREVDIPEEELAAAQRRALLVLAAGGAPTRELEVDEPAVKALAADLHTGARRQALLRGVDELVRRVRDRSRTRDAALFLAADADLAWRLFALALLADALGADS
ncbi:MAG: hypothetical protein JO017_00040 [Actinobacteria bacterium]|nr:hypothetical protein [Actinomycetota bacterium]